MSNPVGGGHQASHQHHLLEVTIISAQDLHHAARATRTYAVAWAHPDHKLYTGLDPTGGSHTTWNDKFVFRIEDGFLRSETSAITIDIRTTRRFLPDRRLGTARIILSTILRPLSAAATTRFVALQVRRPTSLRPQGILNLGIALLDPGVRSMPLYSSDHGTVAFAHKDLVSGPLTGPSLPRQPPSAAPNGKNQAQLERCGSVEVGRWAVERELKALESKLEKWRTELPLVQSRDPLEEDRAAACPGPGPPSGQRSSRRKEVIKLLQRKGEGTKRWWRL